MLHRKVEMAIDTYMAGLEAALNPSEELHERLVSGYFSFTC